MTGPEDPVMIAFPASLARRMRFGPFPDGSAALKFLAWAVVAFLLASAGAPLAALPILSGGLLVALYRPEGVGLDQRVWEYCRWSWRRHRGRRSGLSRSLASSSVLRTSDGALHALLAARGIPIRFLPLARQRETFARFSALLRSLDSRAVFHVEGERVVARPFLPQGRLPSPVEEPARNGYSELVRSLLRHRRQRRVLLDLSVPPLADGAAREALELLVSTVTSELEAMGIPVDRLRAGEMRSTIRGRTSYGGLR
jgi:hypothetical protein